MQMWTLKAVEMVKTSKYHINNIVFQKAKTKIYHMLESQAYAAIQLLPNLIQIIIIIFLLFKQRPRAPYKSFLHKT